MCLYIHLNLPEFTAVTLLMAPVSRVALLHVIVNLNCYVFFESYCWNSDSCANRKIISEEKKTVNF